MTVKRQLIPNFEARSVMLLAAFVVGSAMAQGRSTSPAPAEAATGPRHKYSALEIDTVFKMGDANRDGKISREELARFPKLLARFDQIDTDHDGLITREEFAKAMNA